MRVVIMFTQPFPVARHKHNLIPSNGISQNQHSHNPNSAAGTAAIVLNASRKAFLARVN